MGLALVLVGLPAAANAGPAETGGTLLVSAASSLAEAFRDIAAAFEREHPGSKVELALGASNLLARQIVLGAPADVFASADGETMDAVEKQGLLAPGSRVEFARNRLVLIVPGRGGVALRFGAMGGKRGDIRLAVAAAGVPAGDRAREVLGHLGMAPEAIEQSVSGANVRQVLAYVVRGEVDAGIVYETDAVAAGGGIRLADRAEPTWHAPAAYHVAALRASLRLPLARAFCAAVAGGSGQEILRKRGFMAPGKAGG